MTINNLLNHITSDNLINHATNAAAFVADNFNTVKNAYDTTLPMTSPVNLMLVAAAPIMAVGALSIGTRVISGAAGIGAKTVSEVANLASRVTKTIDDGMDYAGEQFISYSTSSVETDLKLALGLSIATLVGVAVSVLVKAPQPLPAPSSFHFIREMAKYF